MWGKVAIKLPLIKIGCRCSEHIYLRALLSWAEGFLKAMAFNASRVSSVWLSILKVVLGTVGTQGKVLS